MKKKAKILTGLCLATGGLIIPIGSVMGVMSTSNISESASAQHEQTVVNDHYNLDLNKMRVIGYDVSSDAKANQFATDLEKNFRNLLPKVVSYNGQNLTEAEVTKTVESVTLPFGHENNRINVMQIHVNLKPGYIFSDGKGTAHFTTEIPANIRISDHYNIDLNKMKAIGYDVSSDAKANQFATDLEKNFRNLLPKVVSYNGQTLTEEEVTATVESVTLPFGHDSNNRINVMQIHVNLKPGYIFSDGKGTAHFTTRITTNTRIDDHYNLDLNKMKAIEYDVSNDAKANKFANDLQKNFRNLLPKIVSYNGQNLTEAEVTRTVQSVSMQFTHQNNRISAMQIQVNLKFGYVWDNGTPTKGFKTNIALVHVNDHYNIDLNKMKAIGYDVSSDAKANQFATDLEKNFRNLLPKVVSYSGQNLTEAEVTKTVESVTLPFGHDSSNRINVMQIHVNLKPGYVFSDGKGTAHFTTNIPQTRVNDNYTVDMNKFYATGYKLDNDHHANDFAKALKVTWKFQSLLPKITSYQGHSVSQAEVNKTVQSVSIQYQRKDGKIYAFDLRVNLKFGYVWDNGTPTKYFTTNL